MKPRHLPLALAVASALFSTAPAQAAQWAITDIGTLAPNEPFAFSAGYAINDLGQVTGVSLAAHGGMRAFLWGAQTGMQDLGDLAGGENYSAGAAINNAGRVVGSSSVQNTTQGYHAFAWAAGGGMADLGAKPNNGYISFGNGLNAAGDVVGSTGYGASFTAFVLRSGGVMTLLAKPGGTASRATAAADNGAIAGDILESNGSTRATLWTSAGVTDLGDLAGGADYSTALALNEAGQVVGSSAAAAGGLGFVWTSATGMQALADLDGGPVAAAAHGINEAGDIVGFGAIAGGENRAVLWRGGQAIDLSALAEVQAQGWVLSQALGINESGQIVGWGFHDGQQRGFVLSPVLTPVPEPASAALLALGLAAVALRRRAAR